MATPPSDPTSRARLFVALELPGPLREALAEWSRLAFEGDESLRLVEPASLHVTLVFLGSRDQGEVAAIGATAMAAVSGLAAPRLRPVRLVGLPRRRPRVLAFDLDDETGTAAAVQAAVEAGLAEADMHEPERRDYRPHATVARVRRGSRGPAGRFPDPPPISGLCTEIVLYRSDLSPRGARYRALARASLTVPRS